MVNRGWAPVKRYHPSRRELIRFFRAFALLIHSGTDVFRAFRTVAEDTDIGGKKFRAALRRVHGLIETGKSIHEALEEALIIAPTLLVAIEQAESRGALADACADCERYLNGDPIAPFVNAPATPADRTRTKRRS